MSLATKGKHIFNTFTGEWKRQAGFKRYSEPEIEQRTQWLNENIKLKVKNYKVVINYKGSEMETDIHCESVCMCRDVVRELEKLYQEEAGE